MKRILYFKKTEKKIIPLIKKLGLKDLNKKGFWPKALEGMGRFYISKCLDDKKNKYLFKARIMKSREVLKQMRHEVAVYKFFQKTPSLKFLFPSLSKSGKFQGIDWYLRPYQEGILGGNMGKDLGFTKKFLNKYSPSQVAEAILSLQRIPLKTLKPLNLYKHGGWWYYQDFYHYKNTFFKFFLKSPLNSGLIKKEIVPSIENILNKNKKFLDNEVTIFTHGDLYPNNFLILPDKKIFILDWELAHLNNPTFDTCFIWLLSSRDKKWQREFFDLIMKNSGKNFEKLFQLSLISLSIRFASACWQKLRTEKRGNSNLSVLMKSSAFHFLKYYLKILNQTVASEKFSDK